MQTMRFKLKANGKTYEMRKADTGWHGPCSDAEGNLCAAYLGDEVRCGKATEEIDAGLHFGDCCVGRKHGWAVFIEVCDAPR